MNKTKIWIIVAVSLILVGVIIFGGVMTMLKWDFSKLATIKYQTNEYEILDDYKNISITVKTADVVFVPTEDVKTRVVCYEQENVKHSVNVKDGTLVIDVADTRKWYEHIGIGFSSPKVTLYIPKGEYGSLSIKANTGDVRLLSLVLGDVKIKLSTGDINAENISACGIDVSVTTGDVKLNNITCESILSSGSTGDITLNDVVAKGQFCIKRSTGDVKLNKCDGGEINITTSTGDIKGSLLSDKVFIANADTGSVNVPKTTVGGKCQLTTNTGDIRIKIEK